jgi:hypothetical protein
MVLYLDRLRTDEDDLPANEEEGKKGGEEVLEEDKEVKEEKSVSCNANFRRLVQSTKMQVRMI